MILTLGIKILIRSGGIYCSYNNKYGHNLDPTYLKGIKMQSPFCILTSYHGKFRNLGNLYISTFSTSTWLYCPFRIHPVSSTSALSFFRKKIKSFNQTKLTTNQHRWKPQPFLCLCQLDKVAEKNPWFHKYSLFLVYQ